MIDDLTGLSAHLDATLAVRGYPLAEAQAAAGMTGEEVAVALVGSGLDARGVELDRRGAALEVLRVEAGLGDGELVEPNDDGIGIEIGFPGDRSVPGEDLDPIDTARGLANKAAAPAISPARDWPASLYSCDPRDPAFFSAA